MKEMIRSTTPFALAAPLAVAAVAAPAGAAFKSPADWSAEWARGSGTTTYQEWDRFTSLAGPNAPNSPGVPAGAAVAAAAFNPNGTANTYDAAAPADGAFLTSGGNIYSPTGVTRLRSAVPDYNLGGGYRTTVVLQLKTLGNEPDYASVRLNGAAPDYAGELSRVGAPGFGGDEVESWLVFRLPTSPAALSFAFDARAASVSWDRVSIDSITTPAAAGYYPVTNQGTPLAVPEPSAAALVGVAAAGLLARRRRPL